MIEALKTPPHPLRDTFRSAGLNAGDIASFLGLSLSRTQQLLSGRDRCKPAIEQKLQELAALIVADSQS